MNGDEGEEERKDGKWEVDKREGMGRKEVREREDQEGRSGEGRKSRKREVREMEK